MCSGCMCMWFAEYCLAGFAICIYMLDVVTGGWGCTGIEGVRYAVSLYKYAEPWLHACPVTYINTHTYTLQAVWLPQICVLRYWTPVCLHRATGSLQCPLAKCGYILCWVRCFLERIFHLSVCPGGGIPATRTISTENRFYQVMNRNFWRVVKGTDIKM